MKVYKIHIDEIPEDCLEQCPLKLKHQECGMLMRKIVKGYEVGYRAPDERCKLEVTNER